MNNFSQLRNALSQYIDKYPPPTKEQNLEWIRQLNQLDKNSKEYKQIRDRMILSNGGFAMKYVMKYIAVLNDDIPVIDLFQEAMIGVIETIDSFRLEEETCFTTYAHFHIKKRLIDFIKKNKLVKAPRDIARNMKHVEEVRSRLLTEFGREPTSREISKELRITKKIVVDRDTIDDIILLLELNSSGCSDSFINEFNDQVTLNNVDIDEELFELMRNNIEIRIAKFPETVKKAIRLRFGIGLDATHTVEEVAYILNLDHDVVIEKLIPESDRHLLR